MQNVVNPQAVVMSCVTLAAYLGRHAWGHLLTDAPTVVTKAASLVPLLCAMILADGAAQDCKHH